MIYLNGHGADGFIKFRDFEELTSVELAYALQTMYEDNRYHEVFLIADSCRSASMYEWITSPNVLASSSSLTSENSYSYELDYDLGVFVNDRFSYYTTKFLNKEVEGFNTSKSLQDFLDSCSFDKCKSTIGVLTDLYPKDLRKVRVTDFFGSARIVKHLTEEITLDDNFWRTPETF
ncbi:hypothetical protein WR25_00569 [Diploscapter pachys]|uniref:GPI-anchor transamidase n=1 Tax=Diploscapter pachys TaxID=2018661 RepID=A0A2A2JJT4_9BILA|nr:hypothetical protein WR25_00569 [Diploscapter pachys]